MRIYLYCLTLRANLYTSHAKVGISCKFSVLIWTYTIIFNSEINVLQPFYGRSEHLLKKALLVILAVLLRFENLAKFDL